MKKSFAIVLAFFIVLAFAPFSISAQTSDIQAQINTIQAERQKLLSEQTRLQAQLETLNQQSKSLTGNIKELNITRTKLLNDLKITQNNIKSSDLTISNLSQNISKNQTEIGVHNAAIADALKTLSGYDSHTLVYDLLTYDSLSAVWTDTTNLSTVEERLQTEIALLRDTQTALVQNKTAQEAAKKSLVSLQSQLSGQKQVVESTQTAKQKLLSETKNQETTYQKLLADNKVREAQFEAQLFQFESQLKAAGTGSAPSAAHSVLSWPMSKVKITQQFGKTSSSGRLYASGTHNGIDFGTPVGTPVMAVRGGTIKSQGNTDLQAGCYSYGRWILIEHDNGLSTIYGHLSATIVSTGQAIATGQTIGYSGGQPGADGAGFSTGPHLHLGLFVSAGVRVQQYTNSIGCKLVSIPIANPTDYLDPLAYLPSL